jgi:glycosyltransferase involved in cell wall biosynthesis
MRVLMVTFAMDATSPVLWWQDRVARALARRCDQLLVLTEAVGPGPWPANVRLFVVPRWMQRIPGRMLGAKWLVGPKVAAWCKAAQLDVCFVHMAAEWVPRLRPWLGRLRVPIVLWYAHGTTTRRLRHAHEGVVRVLTSSPEGFDLRSDKVRVIGQGIDVGRFCLRRTPSDPQDVVVVGRLSPRKRVDLAILAFAEAVGQGASDLRLRLVGPVLNRADRRYLVGLRELVARLGLDVRVRFDGPLPPDGVVALHETALVHLSVSRTGSLDKAVLEALSTGCPVLASGEAFRGLLAPFPGLFLEDDAPAAIGRRLAQVRSTWREYDPATLRGLVVGRHDLDRYVEEVMYELGALVGAARVGPRA